MTLCIVWKPTVGAVQVVTDSRVAFPQASPDVISAVDFAPKLFSLPYRVASADNPDGTPHYLVNQTIGIATLGSFLSANILVGILGPIVSQLQASPGMADISLKSIADIAGDIFGRVVKETASVLAMNALGKILLVGKCPLTHMPQAWLIGVALGESSLSSTVTSVDLESGPQFFGSGAQRAREIASYATNPAPYRVLQEVVLDESVPTVGGVVQYGALEDWNFYVFAVENYRVDHRNKMVYTGLFVAGLELLRADDALEKRGFLPQHTFLRPFLPDVRYWERLGYEISPFPGGPA